MKQDWQVCDVTDWASSVGAPLPLKLSTNRFLPARWGPRERYWYSCFPMHNTKGEWLFVITGDWHDPDGNQYLVQPPASIGKAAPPAVLEKRVNKHINSQIVAFREDESQQALGRWLAEKEASSPVGNNEYLNRKQVGFITAVDTALLEKDGVLLVPMRDETQELGRQAIKPDGEKRFAYGQKTKGAYHIINGDTDTVYITEGYATAASIYQATGATVYICFSCGNLEAITRTVKNLYLKSNIVIAADNDYKTLNNPGVTHANKAAQALQVSVHYPQGIQGTDWNDYHCEKGLAALREELLGAPDVDTDNLKGYNVAHRYSDEEMTYKDIAEVIAKDYSILCNEENLYVYNPPVWRRLGPTERRVLISEYSPKGIDNENRRKMVESELRLIGGFNMRRHKEEGDVFWWNRLKPVEIAFQNGILNIDTEEMRPHNELDFIDACIPWDYNPNAKYPYWDMALYEWFRFESNENRAQSILALQCFFGYVLLPHCKAKKSLICYGPGDTGKSRVMQAMQNMVGIKNTCTVSIEKLGDDEALSALRGKLVNLINEPSAGALFKDGPFKKLVAGDPVSVRRLYEDAELYQPNCKHALFTNTIPGVRDTTSATVDRWLLLGFNRKFTGGDKDPYFDERVLKEIEGLLAWAVVGAQVLYRNNWMFPECRASDEAVAAKMSDQNNTVRLMSENFARDLTSSVVLGEAWRLYRKSGYGNMPLHEFKYKLVSEGWQVGKVMHSASGQDVEVIKNVRLLQIQNNSYY